MRAISLLYHDVVGPRAESTSGFKAAGLNRYKLSRVDFAHHILMLSQVITDDPVTAPELTQFPRKGRPLLLTFDDGGRSAFTEVAPRLNRLGWRGHFFVPTSSIGTKTFMNADQLRELAASGHVVGSHSHTHPTRIAALSDDEISTEWRTSIEQLSELLGRRIESASVPGGLESRRVAEIASDEGIKFLFTSEPTSRTSTVGNCTVFGRYPIARGTRPETVVQLVEADPLPRIGQWMRFNAKRAAKSLGGDYYQKAWRWLAER